jgi:hypothetical protein
MQQPLLRPITVILNIGLLIVLVFMASQNEFHNMTKPGDVMFLILLFAAPLTAVVEILRDSAKV